MNTDSDLRENDRLPIPLRYLAEEYQSSHVLDVNPFSDHKEGVEQDRNMKNTSFTNQTSLQDLDPQKIEVEDDPELAAIATQLQETASYAMNPTFKEELRKELMQQFIEHRTVETN